MTDLHLAITPGEDAGDEPVVDVLHDLATTNWAYDPELRAAVAEKIRRFPNTDAPHWIGPEAVLGVVERFLLERGEIHG